MTIGRIASTGSRAVSGGATNSFVGGSKSSPRRGTFYLVADRTYLATGDDICVVESGIPLLDVLTIYIIIYK